MITSEQELKATHDRIEQFQQWLMQMRRTARREEFEAVASGYRLEIERMQAEVMEYLLHPSFVDPQPQPA
jgi:pyridoxal/pyridoxine/pyridoxamine kinase